MSTRKKDSRTARAQIDALRSRKVALVKRRSAVEAELVESRSAAVAALAAGTVYAETGSANLAEREREVEMISAALGAIDEEIAAASAEAAAESERESRAEAAEKAARCADAISHSVQPAAAALAAAIKEAAKFGSEAAILEAAVADVAAILRPGGIQRQSQLDRLAATQRGKTERLSESGVEKPTLRSADVLRDVLVVVGRGSGIAYSFSDARVEIGAGRAVCIPRVVAVEAARRGLVEIADHAAGSARIQIDALASSVDVFDESGWHSVRNGWRGLCEDGRAAELVALGHARYLTAPLASELELLRKLDSGLQHRDGETLTPGASGRPIVDLGRVADLPDDGPVAPLPALSPAARFMVGAVA